ncbi:MULTISPECIES: peptide deformylase [Microbacterium]|jgi:peptide deformylase|uniref:Peptide deformylase n=1 Tax=Microbacterium testaceum TaxID=2033 RepID=A0A147F9N6_MICTE|nr:MULTISPECIES: peptide deformylase [Microbacterium]KTS05467.1 peptide deformylase [Microbacterium testaceum]KTS13207.1 peptide deformylase [Microbacterium testaceum]KTS66220.1 peptide deformylase [Microbacterium testaceum]KTS85863.1 peptide deformylase [Microbacterium testaceum]MDQ1077264.1 peptide deformylase [Microbacterium sp. SORGH_AS_0969]
MTVRPIRLFGDPVLRAPSATIETIDDGIHALVRDLLDTVEPPGRAGVAAPQIGVGLRAFSYNIDGDIGYVLNPVLVETRGEPQLVGEGCLSVPGLWHEATRYPWAKVVGIDLDGNEVVLEGEGLLAQALQHETDHLDGMLYLSRLPAETRREAMRQIRESDWF